MAALGMSGLPIFEYVSYTSATQTAYILASNKLNGKNNTLNNINTELRFQPATFIVDFVPYESMTIYEVQRPVVTQVLPKLKFPVNDFANSNLNINSNQISQNTQPQGPTERENIEQFKRYFSTIKNDEMSSFDNSQLSLLPETSKAVIGKILDGNATSEEKHNGISTALRLI